MSTDTDTMTDREFAMRELDISERDAKAELEALTKIYPVLRAAPDWARHRANELRLTIECWRRARLETEQEQEQ